MFVNFLEVYLCSHSELSIIQPLQESLRQYVDRIFTVITKSGVSCPTVMCDIFFSLREAAAKRFQGEPELLGYNPAIWGTALLLQCETRMSVPWHGPVPLRVTLVHFLTGL
jgi:hypothetical protein